MKFFERKTYPPSFYVLSGVGSGLVLSAAIISTYVLWQYGVEDKIFTDNLATSVLFTDALSSVGAAAPWALISVNWLACKSAVKSWRKFLKKKLA